MARYTLTFFAEEKNKGLWINGPRENVPKHFWRRNTGTHAIRERVLRSRDGTTIDSAVAAAHSLVRFDDVRFQAASGVLFRAGVTIATGLDGTPLEFVISEPRVGTDAEYLFYAGGGRLEKVDAAGVVSQWGIEPPTGGNWGTSPGGTGEDDTETTVVDPQERLIADTTTLRPPDTSGWTAFPNAAFVSTDEVLSPSGSAICFNLQEEEQDNISQES